MVRHKPQKLVLNKLLKAGATIEAGHSMDADTYIGRVASKIILMKLPSKHI
jgi:hypothetical protein